MKTYDRIAAELPKVIARPETLEAIATTAGTIAVAAAPLLPIAAIGVGGYMLIKWMMD